MYTIGNNVKIVNVNIKTIDVEIVNKNVGLYRYFKTVETNGEINKDISISNDTRCESAVRGYL